MIASRLGQSISIFVFGIVLLGSLAAPTSVFAQGSADQSATATPAKTVHNKTPKHTSINFEDQLIEGQTQKPELFYLLQQRDNNFKRLIRLRENFLPEMRKTSEDIGHGSGKGNGP